MVRLVGTRDFAGREMSLTRVACHEAGHACAAIYLGRSVYSVEIDRQTHHGLTHTKSKERYEDPMRAALTCLAGDATERMLYRMSRNRHSYGDMKHVMSMGFRGSSIDTLIMHADGLVRALRKPIKRVAAGLLVHGKLNTQQIHRLYHGANYRKKSK